MGTAMDILIAHTTRVDAVKNAPISNPWQGWRRTGRRRRAAQASLTQIRAEVAVPNAESGTEVRGVASNVLIEISHVLHDPLYQRVRGPSAFKVFRKLWRVYSRCKIDEREAPSQRIVHHCQRAIGGIHQPEQVHVVRHKEFVVGARRIRELYCPLLASLVGLDEHHEFPKHLA